MRPSDDPMERTSRTAIVAIWVGAAALLLVVIAVVAAVASHVDGGAREREERLIAKGLQLRTDELRASLTPDTIWDEAVTHLDKTFDPAWADDFIGLYYWRTDGYPLAFVVNGDDRPIYASVRGRRAPAEQFFPFAGAAARLVAHIRADELARGPPLATGNPPAIDAGQIVRVGGGDYVLAASLVQTDRTSGVTPGLRAPIVLTAVKVDPAFLDAFTRRYLVDDLRLAPPGRQGLPGYASVPLETGAAGVGARLIWRPDRPAMRLLGFIGPFLLATVLGLVGVCGLFLRHERRRNGALLVAMREARRASDAKSTFLATVSHEIRTPLNGVLGMVQAMEHDPLPPVQRERLAVIRQSGTILRDLLNDVLDLSKIEAGMLVLDEADFDLDALVLGAKDAYTAVADAKGVELEVDVAPGAGGARRGDPTRVRQVINNLVSNALKFTEAGRVRLALAATRDGVRITVSDTGIGIAPGQIDRLFDKFIQADSSTTRRFGGTGLGLAICRELCDAMGGSIRAESQPGLGSTFTVDLPLAPAATLTEAPAPATAAGADRARLETELRVLGADDNPTNRLVLKTLLAQMGIEPTLVANGAEAVAAFAEGAWDLVLMDVQMPVMDGVEAARRIRAIEAETGAARTPIIALTANAMAHQARLYLEVGMDGHLAKPIEIERLFDVIANVASARPSAVAA